MSFFEKLRERQVRTGKPFWKLCREVGSAGGKRAAFLKRQSKQALACTLSAHEADRLRQVARGVESADAVPDSPFTRAEAATIARESQSARLRIQRLS